MTRLAAARLTDLFSYCPEAGLFTRLTNIGNSPSQKAGYVAGSHTAKGYVVIWVDGAAYKAHRLAWLYTYGVWPAGHIDHINGAKHDNRICNLRDVSRATNLQNQRTPHSNNCSGFIGVHWHEASKSWQAQIRADGKRYHLGVFLTPELAHQAYIEAKRNHHEGCTI